MHDSFCETFVNILNPYLELKSALSMFTFCHTLQPQLRIGDLYGKQIDFIFPASTLINCCTTLPFRAYSLFQYEAANGRMKLYFKGASKISTQIVQRAIIHQEVLTASM